MTTSTATRATDQISTDKDGIKVVRREYDNMTDWLDDAINRQTSLPTSGRTSRDRSSAGDWGSGSRDNWSGASWDAAVQLCRDGWPEGLRLIEERAEQFRNDLDMSFADYHRPAIVHDIAGSMVDVGAYLAGVPDNMMSWSMVEDHAPALRIVVSMSVSSAIGTAAIMNRGAVVCAMIDILESSGRRCEVVGMIGAQAGGHRCEIGVTLKRADEPLQIDKMAYALAHPSAFRRIGFSLMETLPESFRNAIGILRYGGYGSPADVSDECDLYIPASTYGEYSLAWLEEQLRKIGVLED